MFQLQWQRQVGLLALLLWQKPSCPILLQAIIEFLAILFL